MMKMSEIMGEFSAGIQHQSSRGVVEEIEKCKKI